MAGYCETFNSIPNIALSLTLITLFAGGMLNMAFILCVTAIPGFLRMMRASSLAIMNSDYILAAKLSGQAKVKIMFKHILPNAVSPIIVMSTQMIGMTIMMESGLSYLGVGIARALASKTDIIVCDEPVSALDVSIQAQVINLLEDLQANLNLAYIFIAHDLSVVKHISDRIVVMYLGRVVETAPAELLYDRPLHPYTKALMSAVPITDPHADEQRERIKLIGEIPSVLDRPEGCPFCNRCQFATERCRKEAPQMKDYGNGQKAACFLCEEQEGAK